MSIGLTIELPHEQGTNDYVDRPVHFSYFFARKVMFVRYTAAFVALPGGFGTLDELFEALTLIQTEKISNFPVVLVGSDYWSGLVIGSASSCETKAGSRRRMSSSSTSPTTPTRLWTSSNEAMTRSSLLWGSPSRGPGHDGALCRGPRPSGVDSHDRPQSEASSPPSQPRPSRSPTTDPASRRSEAPQMSNDDLAVTTTERRLSDEEVARIDAWWRAANYLSVGQIYLMDNPLLREPLLPEHVKPRLLGHWGTTPGLNFIYAHLNRAITARDLDMIYVIGPGHGGPGPGRHGLAGGHLQRGLPGHRRRTRTGCGGCSRQFSFPGGIPSHVAPETPGSIHEGGELGYALAHAYGAAFDNPDLVVAAVVGDGEAETGPLAASWHSNKFVDPRRDGAVLPILHLNGYKIANPTVLARIDARRARRPAAGLRPHARTSSRATTRPRCTRPSPRRSTSCLDEIADIQRRGPRAAASTRAAAVADDRAALPEGLDRPRRGRRPAGRGHRGAPTRCRSPMPAATTRTARCSSTWLRSYRPEELFDDDGAPGPGDPRRSHPAGERRMSANPHANGGLLLRDLRMPDFRDYAVPVEAPGTGAVESTRVLGAFLRDVMAREHDDVPAVRPRREQLEPARTPCSR